MKILVISDAWPPQINGVVTTLHNTVRELEQAGHKVEIIQPEQFTTLPLPSYPEIRIAVNPWKMGARIEAMQPDAIHVATEGPLGLYARRYLRKRHLFYTTAVHTKFPEYVNARTRLPVHLGYAFLRWFHRPASRILVTTPSHCRELASWGLENLVVWGRGVDSNVFKPLRRIPNDTPRLLYVGRIAVEKNLQAFLELDVCGDKVVVGDGPQRANLEKCYPNVEWPGFLKGKALVEAYANADVLVFPSLTDTFGLVLLESMACGTPVAAFPVTGPKDIVQEGINGALDANLDQAVARALLVDRGRCRQFAVSHDWQGSTDTLVRQFRRIDWRRVKATLSGPSLLHD